MMNAKKSFVADSRGAIMVIGVFMMLFLIGGLWFLLGIGNAMVYRDHMQEVADVSAFTGAVVHARCMNMIAAINLIMIALVAVHLLLAIAHLITLIAAWVACLDPACLVIIPPPVAIAAWKACLSAIKLNKGAKKLLDGYDKGLKVVLYGLSAAQRVLAVLPIIAAPAASALTAYNYQSGATANTTNGATGSKVIGLSEGLSFPYQGSAKHKKLGLPVFAEEAGFLCDKVITLIASEMAKIPVLGLAAKFLGPIAGKGVRALFCSPDFDLIPSPLACLPAPIPIPEGLARNGSWWNKTDRGPKKMWEYTGTGGDPKGNGSDWNSVYGGVFKSDFVENSEKAVAIGARDFAEKNNNQNRLFYAEAEFFYDCTEKWDNEKCEESPDVDHAMYSLGWRARLIRVHLPRVVGGVGILNGVVNLVNYH